jgi:hypothetical protein
MALLFKRLILSLSIAMSIMLVLAADKDRTKFSPAPASSYPAKQTQAHVTIAAEPFVNDEQARPAFGKANPYKYGVLPVLVVIQNDGDRTLTFDELRVEYIQADRNKVESTPASEVPFLHGPKQPKLENSPIPTGPRMSKNKNPLNTWEIGGRAFSAKMLPPGQSASGFFYFQTRHRPGSQVYVTGIREAGTGKALFYFEIPLDYPTAGRSE